MKKITCALASVIIASGCGVAMAQSNNGGGNNATRPGDTGQIGNPSQRITNGTPQGNGAQLYVSPAVVRQIKQGLNQAGYAAGDVNGTWDKKAAGAMKKFQEAQGLAPTGHINLTTLNVLGVNVQTALSGGNGNGGNGNGANGAMTTGSINGNGGANGANGGAGGGAGANGGVGAGVNGGAGGVGAGVNGGAGGAGGANGVPQLNGNQ
ncbi:MAG TPA: peptidoglycan-binding domain-containing protein [Pararhizobium sp.]|nr:peptidoglycan-binding domain-containing protein [Pararhizobium sp.]